MHVLIISKCDAIFVIAKIIFMIPKKLCCRSIFIFIEFLYHYELLCSFIVFFWWTDETLKICCPLEVSVVEKCTVLFCSISVSNWNNSANVHKRATVVGWQICLISILQHWVCWEEGGPGCVLLLLRGQHVQREILL